MLDTDWLRGCDHVLKDNIYKVNEFISSIRWKRVFLCCSDLTSITALNRRTLLSLHNVCIEYAV